MINQESSYKYEFIINSSTSPRDVNHIWLTLASQLLGFDSSRNSPENHNYINQVLEGNQYINFNLKPQILSALRSSKILARQFDWIENSEEQFHFITSHLYQYSSQIFIHQTITPPIGDNNPVNPAPFNQYGLIHQCITVALTYLQPKDLLIAIIDTLSLDNLTKTNWLNSIKIRWFTELRSNKIFDWFKKDKNRINFAWQWLENTQPTSLINHKPFENEKDVRIFFNTMYFSKIERDHTLAKIKKNWTQSEYRISNSDKTQINILLSKNIAKELNKLSSEQKISKSALLERLIKNELLNQKMLSDRTENPQYH